MNNMKTISCLFLDIGGVLLSNGWGRDFRQKAVDKFHLDKEEMEERHGIMFVTYEEGRITLDEYLNRLFSTRIAISPVKNSGTSCSL